jgi:hypothetical protein
MRLAGLWYAAALGAGAWIAYRVAKAAPATIGAAVTAAGDAVRDAAQAVNPLNPGNVFARAADAVVQRATGEPAATLGGKVFELFNPKANQAAADLVAPTMPRAPVSEWYMRVPEPVSDVPLGGPTVAGLAASWYSMVPEPVPDDRLGAAFGTPSGRRYAR